MGQYTQYPTANSIQATDIFLIVRPTVGTMEIQFQNLGIGGRYDIAWNLIGEIPESTELFIFNSVDNYYLPMNFDGSVFTIVGEWEGDIVFEVYRGMNQIGTITFSDGNPSGVGSSEDEVAYLPQQQLRVVSPEGTQSTLNPAFTFKAVPTPDLGI